ncbi:MAG TPA: 6-phosphogluconolactonase [Acidimicrobiia bacterium]|nr:6-phosphogluconolactonase [Acidimicrobiia bacterium]
MHTLTVDAMSVQVHDTDADLAAAAAAEAAATIVAAVAERAVANVMFATGNSQLGFLDVLTARDDVPWDQVVGFHMDEYRGISPEHPASFRRYLRERIVEQVHPRGFHFIAGDAADADAECRRYAALLAAHPLDLCCLGIGDNGHLAFNDPPVADFDDPLDVKVVALDAACRNQQVGEGHFATVDDVPAEAITVTIPALLRAGRVLANVPEARKRTPVQMALTGPVTTACPASILRTRANVTLHLDRESGGDVAR